MKRFLLQLTRILLAVFPLVCAVQDLHAQQRIGVIMTGDIPYYRPMHEGFVAELNRKFSGGEKPEIILQRPFPDPIAWSNAARKLIAFDVDLIVTYGMPATQAVLHEKSKIPLVYAGLYEADQVIVAANKNVTGSGFKVPLSSVIRYFKGLKTVKKIGILCSGIEEDTIGQYEEIKEIAVRQGMDALKIDIRSRDDLAKLKEMDLDAVFITGSSLAHLWLDEILSILKKQRVPTADIFPDDSESGVLMALYQPPQAQGRAAAEMAWKILKGEKPQNLNYFTFRDTELVFNLIEARHLDITFPIHLLIEATKVIE